LAKLRPHLTYANVVSTVCLFVLLGGTAVAATLITSKQIKNGTIQTKDISRKARNALKGQQGPRGLQGPPGSVTGATAGGDLTGTYPNPLVKSDGIGGAEVQDNSLGGADIDESGLALGGFFAATSGVGSCSADVHVPTTCASAVLALPRPGRILLSASSE